jgi:organic radical activating enzyme
MKEKNMRTSIHWELNNYCTGGCTYCPSRFWGGEKPESIASFVKVAKHIIDHYSSLGRKIDWHFTGGEPLEFFDLPEVMKLCKEAEGTIELFTNGGKMWLDWFAVEPNVDNLHLTYHYWQNPNLVKFIIQAFQKNSKQFDVVVPIRPDYFDADWDRAVAVEQEFGILVRKMPLYKEAAMDQGIYPYTEDQLVRFFGRPAVEEKKAEIPKTFQQVRQEIISRSPAFMGKRCNVGIERLHITHNGYTTTSDCGILSCGNVWDGTLNLPKDPTVCNRSVCASGADQLITKFD